MTVRLKERRCRRQEMARKPIAFNLAVEFATAGLPGQPIRLWIVVSQFAQLANTSLRIRHVHHCCAQFEGIARPNGLILKPRFVSTAMPPRCGLASRPRDNLTSMAVVPRSTIDSKGTTISYLDFGGVGQLIVLLHGLAGGASEWTDTAIALTGRGYVIAPDLRGHGHSDRLPQDVSPEAHTTDVVKLIQHLHGGPIKLIGQSFGGLVAYLVAATHPALVTG